MSITRVRRASLLPLTLALALTASITVASQEDRVPDCCGPNTAKLSPQQLKSLVRKTEPIQPPPLANQLRLNGAVVLAIAVDARGIVTCVQRVTGHPLIIGAVTDSVSRWKFRRYSIQGRPTSFCGRIAIQFQGNERMIKYRVVEAPRD